MISYFNPIMHSEMWNSLFALEGNDLVSSKWISIYNILFVSTCDVLVR